MNYSYQTIDTIVIFKVTGEIRDDPDDAFKLAVRNCTVSLEGPISVLLDLGDVSFINSEGMALLLGLRKTIVSRRGNVAIVGLQDKLKNLFNIGGLEKIMPQFDDRESAISFLKEQ